jgi:cytochrome c biogenesis protein CcmG/thiol:disulfide interchange protein DsbE
MSVQATRLKASVMAFLPVVLFLSLITLFVWATLGQRVDRHASPLIGKPAPPFVLPDMAGGQMDLSAYRGKPIILNFYASWCAPCRVEHPQLLQLASDPRFVVLGVAYRDDPAKTAAYLDELGNPYAQTALDRQGAIGVQFGLAGVPETYVISADGNVLLRHQGEITPRIAAALSALATRGAPQN